jgi:glycosyltransferase involved in cell wall biosynthesis
MLRFGGVFNNTGYGIAARDTAYAIINSDIDVTIHQIHSKDVKDCSSYHQSIVDAKINSNIHYDINIAQIIPPMWNMIFEKDKYNIGYFFWETDKLCKEWVSILNDRLVNEIWVPCEYNKRACINSGVRKPIFVIPQCTTISYNAEINYEIKLGIENAFKFYSIFQWTERKNGDGLVRSYLKEFKKNDNVLLVLKTHKSDLEEKQTIKREISKIKASIKGADAPIYLISNNLPTDTMKQIHLGCDCYVTANRGEGWSMPIAEAMSMNKPIITTKLGGITEYLDGECAYIIPHELEMVSKMPWIKWYASDQKWGKISDIDIGRVMREAYNDRHNFSIKTSMYEDILSNINIAAVGNVIKNRIYNIIKENNF